MSDGELMLIGGALLAGGLLAAVLAGRLRLPGLLLFLALGMAIGSDGTGWIKFTDYGLARTIGVIALALILFEGGLSAGFGEIRPVLAPALTLAIFGTILTALIAGAVAAALFDLSLLQGLLLGAILAATDAAAIFGLLRGSTLRRRLARTLEGEAGLNDPVAVLLVIGFMDWISQPGYGLGDMLVLFARQVALGLVVGAALGGLAVGALARLRLPSAGLYPIGSLAVAGLAFGGADAIGGSGFLAVYLAGLTLGSATTPAKRTIVTFHEGVAWVAQVTLFLNLGLLVIPSELDSVALEGTVLAFAVVLLARPLAALVSTAGTGFQLRERFALGWAGLRGAVPVVLATFPVIENVPVGLDVFNVVFFAVLVSTLVQGTTFEPLARILGVTTTEAALPSPLVEAAAIGRLGAEAIEFPVRPGDAAAGRRVRELELPRDALLNLIVRGERAIPPRGSTVVQAGDRLHVLVRQEAAIEFRQLLERWRTGPVGPRRRPPRPLRTAPAITATRPWDARDGDAGRPHSVNGIPVVEQLRTRRDRPGALVALADGRYAIAGPIASVGPPPTLQDIAHRRLTQARDDADRAWWREIIGALARE